MNEFIYFSFWTLARLLSYMALTHHRDVTKSTTVYCIFQIRITECSMRKSCLWMKTQTRKLCAKAFFGGNIVFFRGDHFFIVFWFGENIDFAHLEASIFQLRYFEIIWKNYWWVVYFVKGKYVARLERNSLSLLSYYLFRKKKKKIQGEWEISQYLGLLFLLIDY